MESIKKIFKVNQKYMYLSDKWKSFKNNVTLSFKIVFQIVINNLLTYYYFL